MGRSRLPPQEEQRRAWKTTGLDPSSSISLRLDSVSVV